MALRKPVFKDFLKEECGTRLSANTNKTFNQIWEWITERDAT